MLTAPLTLGETLVIVASAGGNDEHPSWFLNLRDHPQVRVAVGGGPTVDMVARVATADERDGAVAADRRGAGQLRASTRSGRRA